MHIEFDDPDLSRLDSESSFTAGRGQDVVKGFRKATQAIRAAVDERDLYASRGRRFEKLKGSRQHQHSMRLNLQWRLIVEIRGSGTEKRIGVVAIEDYH
jgi:proteic killer suppression protein